MTESFESDRQQDMPVDLTKEEFVAYHMATAKAFGALRRQNAMLILFGMYFAVTVIGTVQNYQETGQISLVMVLLSVVTLVSAVLSMVLTPAQIRRRARRNYDVGNLNGYYGEWGITDTEVFKNLGHERVTMPLDEKTLYIEDVAFMAFVTAGAQRSIILPARCMTKEAAAAVREKVFRAGCRVQRRVIGRMTAQAAEPIPRRDLLEAPQTLYFADATYEEKELLQLHGDIAWKHFVHNLPTLLVITVLFAAMFALIEESVLLFAVITLGIPLAFLLFTTLSGRSTAKRMTAQHPTRLRLTVTERGLDAAFQPSGQRVIIHWSSVRRAVERPTCVDFYYGDNHLLRIPKRCIDDMDELRRIVDSHHTPKK